ncbi:MAG: hypothetical protein EOP84_10465, partial [Verrucomicrobiaceae bacterium]
MNSPLLRFRIVLCLFILGLVLSGITAFPLLHELRLLDQNIGSAGKFSASIPGGLSFWISTVRQGLEATYRDYPWLAYGTDWLAFGHLVIALFFIGPLLNPVPNRWVLIVGLFACFAVIPLALIAGAIRGIPFYWRLIDCSFGIIGALPLFYCLHLLPKIHS